MVEKRKTPQTWIKAGLKALQKSGPSVLRAETLARELNTTKGSFYWHFKDVPAFHAALLAHWQTDAFARVEAIAAQGGTASNQLRRFGAYGPTKVDLAVRAWARYDKAALKSVAAVDEVIVSTLTELLISVDARHPDFPGLIHATLVQPEPNTDTLIDLILALK